MIAELAAFNAAFATIKQAASNGQEIVAMGKSLAALFDAEAQINKRLQKKGQSDIEAYLAKVEIDRRMGELRETLMWTGHWEPFMQFRVQRKKERDAEEARIRKKVAKRRKMLLDGILIVVVSISVLTAVGFMFWALYAYKRGAI